MRIDIGQGFDVTVMAMMALLMLGYELSAIFSALRRAADFFAADDSLILHGRETTRRRAPKPMYSKEQVMRRYPQAGLGWALAVVLIFCPGTVGSFSVQRQRGPAGATDVVLLTGRQHRVDIKLAQRAHTSAKDSKLIRNHPDNIKYEGTGISDAYCRREFVAKAAALSSLISLPILTTGSEAAHAAPDVASATSATTPSIAEGELAISDPPPNRATIIVDDIDDKMSVPTTRAKPVKGKNNSNNKASDPRFFIAGGASAAISHGYTVPIDGELYSLQDMFACMTF